MSRRADVEVCRTAAEKQIANASADQVRGVMELSQPVENFEGVGIDIAAGDRVLRSRNDPRFDHRGHCTKRSSRRFSRRGRAASDSAAAPVGEAPAMAAEASGQQAIYERAVVV
jgi:hypothetical protein